MKRLAILTASTFLAAVPGCREEASDGPPDLFLGEDVCDLCNMIISDERFATATVIEDELGRPETLLYDDFNCQIDHETMHPDRPVLRRWVHDHATLAWLPAERATYLRSDALRTPMASGIAAFAGRAGAEALAREVGGDILSFETIWTVGSMSGGCSHDHADASTESKEGSHDD